MTLRWITVTAARSVQAQPNLIMARHGRIPPQQTSSFISGLPDLSAPVLRSDSHTDHPSGLQKLDSAPGTQTLTQRSGVGRAFHRDLHQKEFLLCWPICMVPRGRKW